MCGIILLKGPSAKERLPTCLNRLKHRGPDDDAIWLGDSVALGFTRLAINGKGPIGRQPCSHGRFVGAINGEIYNYRELASSFGLTSPSECDTHVVLPLIEQLGPRVIDELDGFYAGVIVDERTGETLCFRDHIGKKPLFFGRSREEFFITSELKALNEVDWFEPIPLGVSRVDLDRGRAVTLSSHRLAKPQRDILPLMAKAVRKRMPPVEEPVGLFLSGGLDSSIVAALASQLRDDIVFYTLADPDSSDLPAVETIVETLELRHVQTIPLPPTSRIPDLIRRVVHATESYNPSVISNGLSTYLLAKAARRDGLKVVLTGEGADELFGGYHNFRKHDPWKETRQRLIEDMHFTELRRLDTCSMAHGIEARCPFLDRAVRAFSEQLEFPDLYDGGQNKVTLRRAFEGVLPEAILKRPKTSFDVGSGVRGQVVNHLRRNGKSEREELETIWKQQFNFDASQSYFHRYPVFDHLIDQRGAEH